MDVTSELMTPLVEILLAIAVGIVASARMVVLITADDWPPMNWVRIKWESITQNDDGSEGPWYKLVECPWCISPWIVAVNLAAGYGSDMHPIWWVFNLWLAASLAASWVAIKAGE